MAFAGSPEVFEEMGPKYAENLQRYFRYVRDNDLFLTARAGDAPNGSFQVAFGATGRVSPSGSGPGDG